MAMRSLHFLPFLLLVLSLTDAKDYSLHTDQKPWEQARELCELEGGYLTVMRSLYDAEEVNKLFDTITDPNVEFISIGITDRVTEDEWLTVLGKQVLETEKCSQIR